MCWVMPPGFTGNHVGFAVVVEDRCLAVVNVAHDRHNRWTRCLLPVVIDWAGEAFEHIRCRNAADVVAKLFDHQFGGVGVDGLVHRRHHAHFHQHADHIAGALGHTVGELTHSDGFRHDDVADDLSAVSPGLPWRAASPARADGGWRTGSACDLRHPRARRPRTAWSCGGDQSRFSRAEWSS